MSQNTLEMRGKDPRSVDYQINKKLREYRSDCLMAEWRTINRVVCVAYVTDKPFVPGGRIVMLSTYKGFR